MPDPTPGAPRLHRQLGATPHHWPPPSGIAGGDRHDQARSSTPAAAIGAGSDILVMGRAVTAADDRAKAAEAVHAEVIPVLGGADH